jgi:hypothetical protein
MVLGLARAGRLLGSSSTIMLEAGGEHSTPLAASKAARDRTQTLQCKAWQRVGESPSAIFHYQQLHEQEQEQQQQPSGSAAEAIASSLGTEFIHRVVAVVVAYSAVALAVVFSAVAVVAVAKCLLLQPQQQQQEHDSFKPYALGLGERLT